MRYLDHTGIVDELTQAFKRHQANKKGLSVNELIRQVLGFFADGTHSRLTHFDLLKDDLGYQGVMETPGERLASSHQVKRFFNKFTKVSSGAFRRILRDMAISRIKREQPPVIELFLDTMVMNNDDGIARTPTDFRPVANARACTTVDVPASFAARLIAAAQKPSAAGLVRRFRDRRRHTPGRRE